MLGQGRTTAPCLLASKVPAAMPRRILIAYTVVKRKDASQRRGLAGSCPTAASAGDSHTPDTARDRREKEWLSIGRVSAPTAVPQRHPPTLSTWLCSASTHRMRLEPVAQKEAPLWGLLLGTITLTSGALTSYADSATHEGAFGRA